MSPPTNREIVNVASEVVKFTLTVSSTYAKLKYIYPVISAME